MSEDARLSAERLSDAKSGAEWEDPPRSASTGGAPMLSVAGFEGPLDWLLEMARAKKIDLAKLPIADLITCFVEAHQDAIARPGGIGRDLARWGDWLVMAAALTELRSRLLLPAHAGDARLALVEADALRRHILARQEIRLAADWLERRHQVGRDIFVRGRPDIGTAKRATDITDLLRACLMLLRVPDATQAAYQPRPPPFWQVADAVAHIQRLIGEQSDGCALWAFLPEIDAAAPDRTLRCRAAVASTLLAGLELVRKGTIALEQDSPWTSIAVHSRMMTVMVQDGAVALQSPTDGPVLKL